MFNPDNIREIYHTEYQKLITLLKRKGPTPEKYLELRSILKFFSQNQNNINSDELKMLKNVLIIAESILNSAVPNRKIYKEQKEECKELYVLIKNENLPK